MNTYGPTSRDRAQIAADQAAYEPLSRAGASHEIVTTMIDADVVTTLEDIAASG